jgi:RNA polymerase sigma factor (sigma-70 family)
MYTETELVEGLRNRKNEILEYIYEEYFPTVKYFINANNGNDEEARDVFQETLLVVFIRIRQEDFKLKCSLKTYIYAVSKNLWLKQLSINRRWNFISIQNQEISHQEDVNTVEVINVNEIKRLLYQKYYLELGLICQRILELLVKKISYKDIANILNLKNEQYARKKKYRCLQSLIKRLRKDPYYKIFLGNEK